MLRTATSPHFFPAVDEPLLHQPASVIFSFRCLGTDQLNLGAVLARLLVLISRVAVNRALTPGSHVLVQIFARCFPLNMQLEQSLASQFGYFGPFMGRPLLGLFTFLLWASESPVSDRRVSLHHNPDSTGRKDVMI